MVLNMTPPEELEGNEAVDPEENDDSFRNGTSIGGKADSSEEKRCLEFICWNDLCWS